MISVGGLVGTIIGSVAGVIGVFVAIYYGKKQYDKRRAARYGGGAVTAPNGHVTVSLGNHNTFHLNSAEAVREMWRLTGRAPDGPRVIEM